MNSITDSDAPWRQEPEGPTVVGGLDLVRERAGWNRGRLVDEARRDGRKDSQPLSELKEGALPYKMSNIYGLTGEKGAAWAW